MKTKFLATIALSVALLNPFFAQAEGKNGVAAVVNGEKITVAELREIYDHTPQIHTQDKWDTFYNKALDAWINSKIVQQAADKSNVRKSKEYKEQLIAAGNDIASKLYLRQELDKKINDNDVKNMYNQYKTNFVSEKEIRARHILVDSEASANDIITKIKKGENFDELARKYSKERKSDLGYFTKEMMVPEFGEAAFSMRKGDFSQKPIKTQYGYHIILIDDIRNTQPLSYEDAEPQLRGILAQEALKNVMSAMGQSAKVEKYSLDGKVVK